MSKKAVKPVYYADTETTTYDEEKGVRVYLWCIVDTLKSQYHGFDVESLYKFLHKTTGIFYFHNLKFDWSYLEWYMLKNNKKYKIMERYGQIFKITFGKCELRDSMNLINLSLDELGKTYCKNYHKTSINYDVPYEHQATQEEIEYCFNDVYVLREGLENWKTNMKSLLHRNNMVKTEESVDNKITYASIAFEGFKELSLYDKVCPKTTLNEYRLFGKAYHGGFVYSNPQGIKKNITMIDCNSMYPYIYVTKNLPYGKPYYISEYDEIIKKDFYIISVNITFALKEGYIPIIGGGFGKYGGINYQSYCEDEIELVVCKYDWELIQEFYDIEFTYNWGYCWNTCSEFYKKYGDIFMMEKKNATTKILRSLAKVMLNSPYGKTAMNGLNEIREYYLDEDDVVKSKITGYKTDEKAYQYLPQAISITAQARKHLLTTAKMIGFDKVQYMDTDSIKFDNKNVDLSKIWIDDKELGAWKDEGHPTYFKTIAPKKYIIYNDGKLEITCAGFSKKALTKQLYHGQEVDNDKALELIKKFDKGLSIECLQSLKVKGGRALLKVRKEII